MKWLSSVACSTVGWWDDCDPCVSGSDTILQPNEKIRMRCSRSNLKMTRRWRKWKWSQDFSKFKVAYGFGPIQTETDKRESTSFSTLTGLPVSSDDELVGCSARLFRLRCMRSVRRKMTKLMKKPINWSKYRQSLLQTHRWSNKLNW